MSSGYLADYAVPTDATLGRQHDEKKAVGRSEFQRDRDRIIHSTAFRRLEYKTQVFVNHEGDHFRTRLTHSLEVAQIARSVAFSLGLNVDLVEAVALAHDLGHTPFGHSGQDALNESMEAFGGFEHNLQSLRVIDHLELRYAQFDGLNLCFETREGILKHCSLKNARELGEVGKRFIENRRPSLEAQLANVADGLAYNNHDIDDGLRSGLLNLTHMSDLPVFGQHLKAVANEYPNIEEPRRVSEAIRRTVNSFVIDLTEESARLIREAKPTSLDDVRKLPELICFSERMHRNHEELKQYLHQYLYRHFKVQRMADKAKRVVSSLFKAFKKDVGLLPPRYQVQAKIDAPRAISDYIAGMTDRYAMKEYRQIFLVDSV
ncbi:deoxyguanosinetriphosphate triphosphohydrolase [Burkholderiales bacterium]|nr:deoxyguanosinetriphosphate triphosphohydrolase [Burkholderiales bacterium]